MFIKDIKTEFEETAKENLPQIIESYKLDTRLGVARLVNDFQKKHDKYLDEKTRVEHLYSYENKFKKQGFKLIAGVDEVGRGPLAGPVFACAVILQDNVFIEDVNDSKLLSSIKRERIAEEIRKKAIAIAIGSASVLEIDEINIRNATFKAMAEAIEKLNPKPNKILVDGHAIPGLLFNQTSIFKGDTLSASIAAASIVAKVERDKLMTTYHMVYPEYGFDKHKGYGTKQHIEAIKEFGITPIHRKSFVKNFME